MKPEERGEKVIKSPVYYQSHFDGYCRGDFMSPKGGVNPCLPAGRRPYEKHPSFRS